MTLFKRVLSFLRNGIRMGEREERARDGREKTDRGKGRDDKPRGEISRIEMST